MMYSSHYRAPIDAFGDAVNRVNGDAIPPSYRGIAFSVRGRDEGGYLFRLLIREFSGSVFLADSGPAMLCTISRIFSGGSPPNMIWIDATARPVAAGMRGLMMFARWCTVDYLASDAVRAARLPLVLYNSVTFWRSGEWPDKASIPLERNHYVVEVGGSLSALGLLAAIEVAHGCFALTLSSVGELGPGDGEEFASGLSVAGEEVGNEWGMSLTIRPTVNVILKPDGSVFEC